MRMQKYILPMLASLLIASPAPAFEGYVEVSNKTGYNVHVLQVSHDAEDEWGRDMLGADVLRDGQSARIDIEGYSSPIFDIRAIDEDGDTYTFMDVNVARKDVVITIADLDTSEEDFEGYVEVTNRTGYSIMYLYISHEDSENWEADVLDEDILGNGQTVRVDISGYESSAFDIRAVDEDGDSYTRWAVDIASEDVTFTGRDMD